MIKKHIKRGTSALLTIIMIFSMFSMLLPMQASAATVDNNTTTTSTDNTETDEKTYNDMLDEITNEYGTIVSNDDVGELLSYSGYMIASDYATMLTASAPPKKYTPTFYWCFDTKGHKIKVQQAMIEHAKGSEAYWMTISGKSVFCLEPGKYLTESTGVVSTSKIWNGFSNNKKNAIQLAIAISNTKHDNSNMTLAQQQKKQGSTRLSGVKAEQAQIATQLIIWELVKGERNETAPYALKSGKSGYLNMYCAGGANGNIKKAYNDILDQMQTYNKIPSFMGKSESNAPTITLKASYVQSTNTWTYSTATQKDTNGLLSKNTYASLAGTYDVGNATVKVTQSGNTVKFAVTKASKTAKGKTLTISRKGPTISSSNTLIAYGEPSGGTDVQDLVQGGSFTSPTAYLKLKVDVINHSISRDGSIQKSIYAIDDNTTTANIRKTYIKAGREKSNVTTETIETVLSGKDSTNAGTQENLEGWYYLVTVPQAFQTSYTRERCPAIVLGPTNKQGITNTISDFIRTHFNSEILHDIPEGLYAVYELGKINDGLNASTIIQNFVNAKPNGDFTKTYNAYKALIDSFSIPDNYKAGSRATAKDCIDTWDSHQGTINSGNNEKIIMNLSGAKTTVTVNSVNFLIPPLEIVKSCDDGASPEDYYFEMTNNDTGKTLIIGPTDSDGTARIYQDGTDDSKNALYTCGTYTVKELGRKDADGNYYIPEWYVAPDPIEVEISARAYTTAQEAGYDAIQLNFQNRCQGKIAVHKTDSITGKNVPYVKYAIYSDRELTHVVEEITTDGSGYGESTPLEIGTYYVQESESPAPYAMNSKIYTVKVEAKRVAIADNIYTVETTDNPNIKLQLMKSSANPVISDGNTCYSLEGAVYTIYTSPSCTTSSKIGTIKTDSDGYGRYGTGADINIDTKDKNTVAYRKNAGTNITLQPGVTYYCKETTSPKGYLLNDTVYTFKDSGSVTSSGVKIYRAYDSKKNKQPQDVPGDDPLLINIYKQIEGSASIKSETLNGAIFRISYYDTLIDEDIDVTDDTPPEDIPQLESGNLKRVWYIQTKTNPEDNTPGYAKLEEEYIYSKAPYVSQPLYRNLDKEIVLPIGTIVVEEVQAPNGYFVNNTVSYRKVLYKDPEVTQDQKPIQVFIDEQPANGYIGLHKMNNAGSNVPNAVYGLYSDEDCKTEVARLTTTNSDQGDVFNYEAELNKTYYIKEISAPPNTSYVLDKTVYPVTPTDENMTVDAAVIQDIYEDAEKGTIVVEKSANDGVITNLWFALSDNKGHTYPAKRTNLQGKVTWTGLPKVDNNGKAIRYNVRELGFRIPFSTPIVTIYDPDDKQNIEAYKFTYAGQTWYLKKDSAVAYEGSYYEPASSSGGIYVNKNDVPSWSRYVYGGTNPGNTYGLDIKFDPTTIKEPPTDNRAYATMSNDTKTIFCHFNNLVPVTDVEIHKESYNKGVANLYFEVYNQYDTLVGTVCTDENGDAKLTDLPANLTVSNSGVLLPIEYYVVEKGYRQPDGTYYLPANYNVDAKITGPYGTLSPLYNSTSTINYTKYTDGDGVVHYAMTYTACNNAVTGKINIEKNNPDDGIIENLGFKIEAFDGTAPTVMGWDADGNEIKSITVTTNSEGKASSSDVQMYDRNGNKMIGILKYVEVDSDHVLDARRFIKYRITELGIKQTNGTYVFPKNYELVNPKEYTFESNTSITYTCTNHVIYGNVNLYKTDPNGASLAGSEWQLYDNTTGKVITMSKSTSGSLIYYPDTKGTITTMPTTNDGILTIQKIPVGDYYLVETKAPAHRMPYGDKLYFTVVDNKSPSYKGNNYTFEISVPNHATVLPKTGETGTAILYLIGITFATASAFTFTIYKRKRKRMQP